tara:strand:- start:1629 stop:1829 length:201 start_codon:yes stop_codon:yes gene_type:complete
MEKLHHLFHQFDKDNNGSINKKELSTLAIALNDPLTAAELQDFFRAIDTDNSSHISWQEFQKHWEK